MHDKVLIHIISSNLITVASSHMLSHSGMHAGHTQTLTDKIAPARMCRIHLLRSSEERMR